MCEPNTRCQPTPRFRRHRPRRETLHEDFNVHSLSPREGPQLLLWRSYCDARGTMRRWCILIPRAAEGLFDRHRPCGWKRRGGKVRHEAICVAIQECYVRRVEAPVCLFQLKFRERFMYVVKRTEFE